MGQRYNRGAALVCPLLEGHVADVLKDRSAIQKERRKAREERTLQPQPPQAFAKKGARKPDNAGGGGEGG